MNGKEITLTVSKEFVKTVDNGSNRYLITVWGNNKTPFFELSGEAVSTHTSGMFHIDDSYEEELNRFGIESECVVEALESGSGIIITSITHQKDTSASSQIKNRVFNSLCDVVSFSLSISSIKKGEDYGVDSLVGISRQDGNIIEEEMMSSLCYVAKLTEEWNLLLKYHSEGL